KYAPTRTTQPKPASAPKSQAGRRPPTSPATSAAIADTTRNTTCASARSIANASVRDASPAERASSAWRRARRRSSSSSPQDVVCCVSACRTFGLVSTRSSAWSNWGLSRNCCSIFSASGSNTTTRCSAVVPTCSRPRAAARSKYDASPGVRAIRRAAARPMPAVAKTMPRAAASELARSSAFTAVAREPVDDEHVSGEDRERPEDERARRRELRERIDERRDDADDRGPAGAFHDGPAREDLDDPDDEEEPTPRVQVREQHVGREV